MHNITAKQELNQQLQSSSSVSPKLAETITQKKQWTIEDVQNIIEERQKKLENQPLFKALDNSSQIDDLQAIAPHFYFFILIFQDMLRLTHNLISDSVLKKVAASLMAEDAGHEQWYLFDIEQLNCKRDISWVFGATHQPVRDFAYGLIGDLLYISDDRIRIIFPLVLEATAKVFFKYLVDLVQRCGYNQSLQYFGTYHQEIEMNHNIHQDGNEELHNIEFDENTYREAVAFIHRCFDYFECFADHLECQRADGIGKE
ncbi:hypothetical protein [Okeania sp. KiyG1]|uniref:hypothetical protein n=1 Tax=Okeania sp. KiyG1 TaxID=2720165 RepID=UPI0019246A21|nr:hypothetical protein [Okeania sp. KiyG1]GGA16054.1 hypothetical protein CYANOKiyG1_30120 [Okeania sp. KiyG1]